MFCANCGNKIEENTNFCNKCGNKIETNNISTNSTSSLQSPTKKGVKIEYNYDGVIIQVVNQILKEALYVNGVLIDQHYTGLNAIWGKTLILKAINYQFKSGNKTIQVFCKSGLVSNKFMLCIDDIYVAGEKI